MAKRRSNNEGSIYKRSDGGWRAQVTIDGERMSFSAKTQKECQAWLKETVQLIDQGFTFEGKNVTLEEFMLEWLVNIKSSRANGTIAFYTWKVNVELLPKLGKFKLADLRPEVIQRFYNRKLKEGKSNHSVHFTHKVLNTALTHAVKLGLLAKNPCKATTPPRPDHNEMSVYDEDQIQILLITAKEIGDPYYPVYYLALHTGMRQGELLGLRWDDLDWDKRTLRVQRQVVRPKGGGFDFTKPKSKSGIRTIILGNQMLSVLRDQQSYVNVLKEDVGKDWKEHNLMFPSLVGTPVLNSNLRRSFARLLGASGLPKLRFHDLRHTAASLMLNHGIPVLIVSKRLGHSKPSITLDVYGHLIPSKQEEAAELMDDLIAPVIPQNP